MQLIDDTVVCDRPHRVLCTDCWCIDASIASVRRSWSEAESEGDTGDGTASVAGGQYPSELCGRTVFDGIGYSPPVAASYLITAGLRPWEREVVELAAMRYFSSAITGITTFGTYAYRRIGGGFRSCFSEHASANTINIAAFTLTGGEQVRIAAGWNSDGAAAVFLREKRNGTCRILGTTLSP